MQLITTESETPGEQHRSGMDELCKKVSFQMRLKVLIVGKALGLRVFQVNVIRWYCYKVSYFI